MLQRRLGGDLAGPRDVIEQVARDRKVFGSSLFQVWPYAAVATHYLEGFTERFRIAIDRAKALFTLLEEHGRFRVEPVARGTNIYKLHVKDVDMEKYRAALAERGIRIPRPNAEEPSRGVSLAINESINRKSAPELADVFIESLPK